LYKGLPHSGLPQRNAVPYSWRTVAGNGLLCTMGFGLCCSFSVTPALSLAWRDHRPLVFADVWGTMTGLPEAAGTSD
jgi:hypothetical protein